MSGTTEQPLNTLPVVATVTGLRILGFDGAGKPSAVEPGAFQTPPPDGAALSDAAPLPLGAAAAPGTAPTASRADHVHARPTPAQIGAAPATHTHVIADVTNLQASLDGKAPTGHSHTIANVTGLQVALDSKAPLAHSHPMSDVIGLEENLNGKLSTSARGVANGIAPLDGNGRVPLANLPETTGGVSNVTNGNLDGQVPVWNVSTSRYQPQLPDPITRDRTPTVERNSPTTLSFLEYNRRNIVLTANAPLTLAASEIGTPPNQGMEFLINNRHDAINTITFGAGITVDANPIGTGTAGSVKVAARGVVVVSVMPVGTTLVAVVRGQID